MYSNNKIFVLFMLVALSFALISLSPNGSNLALAEKKADILFVKGKFILKDKKGSIVISEDKKCHCPPKHSHYHK